MQKKYTAETETAQGIETSGLSVPIQYAIWDAKYRDSADLHITDTWGRIAKALAQAEKPDVAAQWETQFLSALTDFRFITAGRILSGAGTGRDVTLLNCFVMGTLEDSMQGIFSGLEQSAISLQRGGGIGQDFSTLRPAGSPVKGVGADASGPVSFMDVWDGMCKTIMSAGNRRGAMMGTMRCDHPDIETFIEVKQDPARLRNFNLSVLVTDAFMEAVSIGGAWDLRFDGVIYKTVPAVELWNKIMRSAYAYAEPGVIFIDRLNAANNLNSIEKINATNPCGEQPLPPYGACCLGSINLAALVRNAFTKAAGISNVELRDLVGVAVRMLDNVIDVSKYPLFEQAQEARNKRRIGLGVTGLADALAMCGLHYGSAEARVQAAKWMQHITDRAYEASIDLAKEKGAFPLFDWTTYGRPGSVASNYNIPKSGIRNSHLTSIAPTGTISLLAGNVSSGIEPIFDLTYTRKVRQPDGSRIEERVEDYAYAKFWSDCGGDDCPQPSAFVTVKDLQPEDHLLMQAALQPYVDSSISKTINCPEDMPFEVFESIYQSAYDLGLKGCTAYRPNDITGSVLSSDAIDTPVDLVAHLERQAAWSAKTFGPGARTGGLLKHIRKELTEIEADPSDPEEWIDVAILAFDGAFRTGRSPRDIAGTWLAKQDKNEARTWPDWRGKSADEPIEHDRSEEWESIQVCEGPVNPVPTAEEIVELARKLVIEKLQKAGEGDWGIKAEVIPQLAPREEVLEGRTYKLKWPLSEQAFYITINDTWMIEATRVSDLAPYGLIARRRPFEIFINSKNLESYAWTVALTRMLSAVFRRGGDVFFVVEELKAVFDPKGGAYVGGKYVPSIAAAIGGVIEEHLAWLDKTNRLVEVGKEPVTPGPTFVPEPALGPVPRPLNICPKCSSINLKRESGCVACRDCDYSKCG